MPSRRWIESRLAEVGVLGTAGLIGCVSPAPDGLPKPDGAAVPPVVGDVDFGAEPPRAVAAKFAEVANGATVSLIDPDSGNTVSTTLTTPEGKFRLSILSGDFKPDVGPYYLEAVKGLSVGGNANRAGAPAARVRTLISFQQANWISLSAGRVSLNRSTTAVAALSSLKSLSREQNLALFGRITLSKESTFEGITTYDSFDPTTAISGPEFHRTWDLVAQALRQDADPIGSLFLRPADGTSSVVVDVGPGFGKREGIAWASDGFVLSGLSPVDAAPGDQVTLYGHGLPVATDSATVWLGDKNCPVMSTDGKGTAMTFKVAAGASTGSLEFRYGPWINRSLFLIVN